MHGVRDAAASRDGGRDADASRTRICRQEKRSVAGDAEDTKLRSTASHGETDSRRVVLEIADKTLQRLDAYDRIKSIAHLDGDIPAHRHADLGPLEEEARLPRRRRKGMQRHGCSARRDPRRPSQQGNRIVKVAEEGDVFRQHGRLRGRTPAAQPDRLRGLAEDPGTRGQSGARRPVHRRDQRGKLGAHELPGRRISLQDEIDATDVLLKSGAGIYEINAIRRHISQTNGGMLAKRIQASGAELIGFGISDAVGNPPTATSGSRTADYASTPIGPDKTTLAEARRVIADYDLADRLPSNVVRYLMEAGDACETPKAFPDNTYYLLNTVPDSCIYAKEVAEEMGIPAYILTSFLEGESKDAGTFFASLAREVQAYGNPFPAPCVILSSGETTTQDPGQLRRSKGTGDHRRSLLRASRSAPQRLLERACSRWTRREPMGPHPWPAASPTPRATTRP